ncbi:NLI interacting factor-like phosphatase-domain-containing protein [Scleroderma yunnanense]
MNSLAYISRRFDGLFSPRTPPSTPVSEFPPFLRRRGSDSSSVIRAKTQPFLLPDSSPHIRRPKRSYSSPSGFFPPPPPSPPPLPVDPVVPPQTRFRLRSVWRRIHLVRVLVCVWNTLCASWVSSSPPEIERKGKDIIVDVSVQEKSLDTSDESPSPFSPITPSLPDILHSAHHPLPRTDVPLPTPPPSPPPDSPPASQPHLPSLPSQGTSRVPTPTSAHKTPFHLPKTLVLDLDETLIHSTSKPLSHSSSPFGLLGFGRRNKGHTVEVVLDGRSTLYHVYKRPFVDYFLRKVSSWYTLVVFTASMQEYADPVIDWLDAGRGILTRRFFRESCTVLPNGSYTKDLSIIEQDLSRVCLVDNSPISYRVNQANGIPIEGWTHDPSDEALLDLLPILDSLRFTSDVRRVLGLRGFAS